MPAVPIPIVIGAAAGAVIGYFFHKFIGCRTGGCVIAGNRYLSILYWAIIGALAANILAKLLS
ncbi:MAG: DUF6132 family protein [Acidobacteriota bacterium]|nr:DUF6132 family protein [Acidobacteriota bacterium]